MRRFLLPIALALAMGVMLLVSVQRRQPQPPLPTITITVGGQPLVVEVARTASQRRHGLKGRTRLAEGEGMLFVYETETPLTFWMKDTAIPLSLAFIRNDGTIVQIVDMHPFDKTLYESETPVQYALEVPLGYFVRHQIHVGDYVDLTPTGTLP
jgi:uncharacterized protein